MLEELANISGLLLKGPPGVGKLEWCLELIDNFLEHDKKIVIVGIDYSPETIRQRAFKFDIDLRKYEGENLVFVDCFSAPLGKLREGERTDGTMYVSSLSNIEQIGMNITKASDVLGEPINLFFYSLSPLFLHNAPQALLKFFQIMSSQLRTNGGFGVFALHEGVQDERTGDTLGMMVDGVVEMRFDEMLHREIRIHHIKGIATNPVWTPFDIGGELVDVVLSERVPKVRYVDKEVGIDKLL
ncbi:MAG: hypothetical protein KAR39_00440 [Thermoplasmata archaeon]|nr:hypothetical protein [Thermoplasmata archaeon]